MISPIYVLFFIFFHIIENLNSQESQVDILGPSACDCYGLNNHDCGFPDSSIESLPKDCSSYIYMNIFAVDNTLVDQGENDSTIHGYLDKLIKTNITVLVYYYHANQIEWCKAVQCNTTEQTAEMNNLKSFLDKHPGVKGIILRNLLDTVTEVTPAECPNYSKNLQKYIDLMRKTFTNLSIGIVISSKRAKDWYKNPELAWIDFNVLNSSVDFYVVNFLHLNKCSDEFTKTGCYPLCGNSNDTVDAIKTFLVDAGVPLTKVHYTFYNYGDAMDAVRACDANPVNFCKNVTDAKTFMCMDTLQTLYDKGAFAKTNGAGFVVETIDSDDFDSTCQCGQLFPGFYALLNGYNGAPAPEPCALFDRT